jgi:hypothetical protein
MIFRISASELNKAVCNLKNGKSPGLDMIGNELLKTAQTYLNPLKFRGTGQKLVEFHTLSCCPFLLLPMI